MSSNGTLLEANAGESRAVDLVGEALVEHIWQEMQGKTSRTQIRQIVTETVSEFAHATVTTYLPIFIRRRVREKLALAPGN